MGESVMWLSLMLFYTASCLLELHSAQDSECSMCNVRRVRKFCHITLSSLDTEGEDSKTRECCVSLGTKVCVDSWLQQKCPQHDFSAFEEDLIQTTQLCDNHHPTCQSLPNFDVLIENSVSSDFLKALDQNRSPRSSTNGTSKNSSQSEHQFPQGRQFIFEDEAKKDCKDEVTVRGSQEHGGLPLPEETEHHSIVRNDSQNLLQRNPSLASSANSSEDHEHLSNASHANQSRSSRTFSEFDLPVDESGIVENPNFAFLDPREASANHANQSRSSRTFTEFELPVDNTGVIADPNLEFVDPRIAVAKTSGNLNSSNSSLPIMEDPTNATENSSNSTAAASSVPLNTSNHAKSDVNGSRDLSENSNTSSNFTRESRGGNDSFSHGTNFKGNFSNNVSSVVTNTTKDGNGTRTSRSDSDQTVPGQNVTSDHSWNNTAGSSQNITGPETAGNHSTNENETPTVRGSASENTSHSAVLNTRSNSSSNFTGESKGGNDSLSHGSNFEGNFPNASSNFSSVVTNTTNVENGTRTSRSDSDLTVPKQNVTSDHSWNKTAGSSQNVTGPATAGNHSTTESETPTARGSASENTSHSAANTTGPESHGFSSVNGTDSREGRSLTESNDFYPMKMSKQNIENFLHQSYIFVQLMNRDCVTGAHSEIRESLVNIITYICSSARDVCTRGHRQPRQGGSTVEWPAWISSLLTPSTTTTPNPSPLSTNANLPSRVNNVSNQNGSALNTTVFPGLGSFLPMETPQASPASAPNPLNLSLNLPSIPGLAWNISDMEKTLAANPLHEMAGPQNVSSTTKPTNRDISFVFTSGCSPVCSNALVIGVLFYCCFKAKVLL